MSTTAAIIARLTTAVFSSEKGRTAIASVIAGIIMAVVLPVMLFCGIFASASSADADEVAANLSSEETAAVEHMQEVFDDIDAEFAARGLDELAADKAKIIYLFALYDFEDGNDDFVSSLADCYQSSISVDTFYTDDSGYLITLTPLEAEQYLLVEVEAGDGFEYSGLTTLVTIYDDIDTTISGDGGLWIKLYDDDAEEYVYYTNAGFHIYFPATESDNSLVTQTLTYTADSDEAVRQNVNSAFSVEISEDDFSELMDIAASLSE
ncbi:MAG: hypothetical protein LUH82_07870 [Clostridiales bacterium]|nr:hypothetical protein [Clostridiales bacterium]